MTNILTIKTLTLLGRVSKDNLKYLNLTVFADYSYNLCTLILMAIDGTRCLYKQTTNTPVTDVGCKQITNHLSLDITCTPLCKFMLWYHICSLANMNVKIFVNFFV
jgi:hypothetical protein